MANKKSFLLVFVLAVCFLSGCTTQPKEKKLETITIALQNWEGYGLLYLAQEKGFFKDEGIELVFIDEQLDSARRDAFNTGMLDCEGGTIDLLISKRSQDTPVVAVLGLDHSFGADCIVVSQDIRSLEDLIGKKVSLARDDVGETFLSYLLYKQGIPFDKIIVIPRRPEEVVQPFLNGEVDAVATWEPQVSEALKRPGSHILFSTKDVPEIIIDTLNVREDVVKNNPQKVKALMRGWFKGLTYYEGNPIEASEIIAKYYNITAEQYRKDVQGLSWIDYAEQDEPLEFKKWADTFNIIADIKFTNGRIAKKPDSESAINGTLIKELYEDSR